MLILEITNPEEISLAPLAREIRGKQTFKQIAELVRKHFPMTTVKVHMSDKIESGSMNVGAHYDPEADEEGEIPIHIDLFFSDSDEGYLEWTKEGRKFFLYKIKDVMKHELLHLKQHRNRDFHPGRDGYVDDQGMEYEYMSRPDEIEAYAMNIADELKRAVGKEKAFDLLRSAAKTTTLKDKFDHLLTPDLMAYFVLFKYDPTHPVLKKLLKKIYIYLNK